MKERRPTYLMDEFSRVINIPEPSSLVQKSKDKNLNVPEKDLHPISQTSIEQRARENENNENLRSRPTGVKSQFKLILDEIKLISNDHTKTSKESASTELRIVSENKLLQRTFEVMNSSFQIKNFNEQDLIKGYANRKYVQRRDSVLSLTDQSIISKSLSLAEQIQAEEEEEERNKKSSLSTRLAQTIDAHYSVVSSSLVEANKVTGRALKPSRLSRMSSKRSVNSTSARSQRSNQQRLSKASSNTNNLNTTNNLPQRKKRLSLINEGNDKPDVTRIKLDNIQLDFKTQQAKITKLAPYMLPHSSRTQSSTLSGNEGYQDSTVCEEKYQTSFSARSKQRQEELKQFSRLAQNFTNSSKIQRQTIDELNNRYCTDFRDIEKNLIGTLESKRFSRASNIFKLDKAMSELLHQNSSPTLTIQELRKRTEKLTETEYNSARLENIWFEEIIKRYFAQVTKFSILDKRLFLALEQIIKDRVAMTKTVFKQLITELFKDIKTQTALASRVTNYIAFNVVDFEVEEFKDLLNKNNITLPLRIGRVKKEGNALKLAGGMRALTLAMRLKNKFSNMAKATD